MHDHFWNADVYKPNPLVCVCVCACSVWVCVCCLLPAVTSTFAFCQTTVLQHLHSVFALDVRSQCAFLGAFTPRLIPNDCLIFWTCCPVCFNLFKNNAWIKWTEKNVFWAIWAEKRAKFSPYLVYFSPYCSDTNFFKAATYITFLFIYFEFLMIIM